MMQRIVLYGSGNRCSALCEIIQQTDLEIITILDSNLDKWGCMVEEYKVERPDRIYELQEENICITIGGYEIVKEIFVWNTNVLSRKNAEFISRPYIFDEPLH